MRIASATTSFSRTPGAIVAKAVSVTASAIAEASSMIAISSAILIRRADCMTLSPSSSRSSGIVRSSVWIWM